jgi:hypothetical protein
MGSVVANFFCSVGYAAENVHSGMIAYLCDLWNEGEREPLGSFLDGLGVSLETENDLRRPDREWQHIDLVVHDNEDDSPILAIEMKVDSNEARKRREPQTIAYPKLLPEGTLFLFVTLGAGEYYHAPHGRQVHGDQLRWIRLRRVHEALKGISTDDLFIERWRKAIGNELDLRDRCFSADPSRRIEEYGIEEYRGKTWNLYLLGHLKEKLNESLLGRDISIDPFVYTEGRGPDTILYFGRSKLPAYLEINQDGRLNLKVYLGDLEEEEEPKRERAQKAQKHYRELLDNYDPKLTSVIKLNPDRRSKKIMSFDIGLERHDKNLFLGAEESEIVARLSKVLEKFYSEPPFDDIDIDPSVHHPFVLPTSKASG